MFFLILLLFFFLLNWFATYVMAIIPIHLFTYLGSLGQLLLLAVVLLILSWFFGE